MWGGCWYKDVNSNGCSREIIDFNTAFCPTVEHLLPLVTKAAKAKNVPLILKNNFLLSDIFGQNESWWQFSSVPIGINYKTNFIEYLANVLIYLISKPA